MVGVKNGDDALDHEHIHITKDLQTEGEAEFQEQKVFTDTLQSIEIFENIEEEVKQCLKELDVLLVTVLEFSFQETEDVHDAPDEFKFKDKIAKVDPIYEMASEAANLDLEHAVSDSIGNLYRMPEEPPILCCDVEISMHGVKLTRFTVQINLFLDVSLAGEDILEIMNIDASDTELSKDSVKDANGDMVEVIGEKYMNIIKDNQSISTRFIFIKQITGIHLSWYASYQLNCLSQ